MQLGQLKIKLFELAPIGLLLFIVIPQLFLYSSITASFVFSICIFIFSITKIGEPAKVNWIFYAGLAFYFVYFLLKVQSVFLMGFVCSLIFLISLSLGRINNIPLFVGLIALPISSTILNLISFDLRLLTTKWASSLLQLFLKGVAYEGNIIIFQHFEYGVDDVCSGIVMIHTGLLVALILLASLEKRLKKTLSILELIAFMILAFTQIFIANLIRIIIMVFFKIDEQLVLHDLVGIGCLILYFAIPFYYFSFLYFNRKKIQIQKIEVTIQNLSIQKILILCLSLSTAIFSIYVLRNKTNQNITGKEIIGYQLKQMKYGVVQYSTANCLIYMKPEVAFYAADHHPKLCWKGSGYKFTNEKFTHIQGNKIVTAILKNENGEALYSSYWFQNGNSITSDELTWRWNAAIHQAHYKMINVTASNEKELKGEVEKIMEVTRN